MGVKALGDILVAGLALLHHEILLFAAVGLAIGGVDDFLIDLLFLALGLVAGAGGMSAYQVYPFTQPATSTGMAGMRCYSRFTARHTIGGAKGGLMPSSGAKADKSLMRRLMLAR